MSEESANQYGLFLHWIADAGLYSPHKVDGAGAKAIVKGMEAGKSINVDCFCPYCNNETVFKHFVKTVKMPPPSITSGVTNYYNPDHSYLKETLQDVTFSCARNNHHKFRVIFAVKFDQDGNFEVTKIGQYPSKLDLVSSDIRKYSKLAPDDAKELHSAAISSSAGFHVAAFVYLRRVFERRLEIAHEAAKSDSGWDESEYNVKMRMEDRIAALRDHLPEFLVNNRKIYSILSKGIHELTEEECSDAYATMEVGIGLILDEELEKQRRDAKLAAVAGDLQKLQEKHNS